MSVTITQEQEVKMVKELGDAIGYGNLMSMASALWRKMLIEEYGNGNGAFVPTILSFLKREDQRNEMKSMKIYDKIVAKQ